MIKLPILSAWFWQRFLWSRNPFKMTSLRDWYSWSCFACLWRFCSHILFYLSSLLMALSCDDISGLLSSSHSAKISAIWGSDTLLLGCVREHLVHGSWSPCTTSNQWLFRIGISTLWSVIFLKFCSSARNILQFKTVHTTASISSSIVAYLGSALDRKWSLPVLGSIYLWSTATVEQSPILAW